MYLIVAKRTMSLPEARVKKSWPTRSSQKLFDDESSIAKIGLVKRKQSKVYCDTKFKVISVRLGEDELGSKSVAAQNAQLVFAVFGHG
jgi:hypothetical protein